MTRNCNQCVIALNLARSGYYHWTVKITLLVIFVCDNLCASGDFWRCRLRAIWIAPFDSFF